MNDSLLKYTLNHVTDRFKSLNDYLGFGEAGGYGRLRPHMIRKFHSIYLSQGSLTVKMPSMDEIDLLHGRGKNKTCETYFKDNSEYLKIEYVMVMNNGSLYQRYDYKIANGKIKISPKPVL